MTLNGPTALTLIRIVLVIPVVMSILIDSVPAHIVSIVCFVMASITDFMDGRWARREKMVTDLGAFLDPLADKMLVNLTFLSLVVLEQVPVWMFAVILVRDYAVDGLRMVAARKKVTISASIFGKIKTTVQMITLILILFNMILCSPELKILNDILLYIVVFLTLYSGVDYLIRGRKLMI